MCGFLGAYTFQGSIQSWLTALVQGLDNISHRGPDAGKYISSDKSFSGHRRLSIIDLTANSNQPLFSTSANAHIIFNGEIYNYQELKKELSGNTFNTASDTEVILEGYLTQGTIFFKKLRGIYAFAIYDSRGDDTKILLVRDPSGIKPLYYFQNQYILLFGSEIKALLPAVRDELTVNEKAIRSYLNLSYIPEPYTAYREIKALEPGHVLMMEHGHVSNQAFHIFDFNSENKNNFRRNVEIVEEKLQQAVQRNLVADVEVAVALSGGIDSSLIYAYANQSNNNIKGFTARFSDGEYNEADVATRYAQELAGKQVIFDIEKDFNLELLKRLLLHFDQPYADSSAIPVYYLTKNTAAHTKVLIGGDGGDELFNGYPSQTRLANIYRYNRNSVLRTLMSFALAVLGRAVSGERKRSVQRMKDIAEDSPLQMLYDWHSWFPRKTNWNGNSPFVNNPDEGYSLYSTVFREQEPDSFTQQIVFDYYLRNMLSDYLRKTDMMSMINHVEYRVPILDEDLVQFVLSIPFQQKSNLKETKKFLRYLHAKIYPPETSNAPKHGFSIPLDVYLSAKDYMVMREDLLDKNSYVQHFVSGEYITFLFDMLSGKISNPAHISRAGLYQRILILYALHIWYVNK